MGFTVRPGKEPGHNVGDKMVHRWARAAVKVAGAPSRVGRGLYTRVSSVAGQDDFGTRVAALPSGTGLVPLSRALRIGRHLSVPFWASLTELLLVVTLALFAAQLIWTVATPMPLPVFGNSGTDATASANTDHMLVLDFDPFHRASVSAAAQQEAVAPETTLDLKLYGVRALKDPKAGSAIIRLPDHTQVALRVGMTILEGVTLAAVHPDRVVVSRRGALETLSLDDDKASRPAKPSAPARPKVVPGTRVAKAGQRTERQVASPSASRGQPKAANRQTAARQTAARQTGARKAADSGASAGVPTLPFENGADLLRTLKPKAAFDSTGFKGLYLGARGDGKLPKELGVAEGDVLVEVNGIRLTSMQRVERVWDRLDSTGPVSLVIERNGAERTVDIMVGAALSR